MDAPAVGEVAPQTLEEAFRRIEALEQHVFTQKGPQKVYEDVRNGNEVA
jgi:hypothetical protein